MRSFIRNLILSLAVTFIILVILFGFDPSLKTGWESLPDTSNAIDGCNPAKYSILGIPLASGLQCGDFPKTPSFYILVILFILSYILVSIVFWIVKKFKHNETNRPNL